MTLYLTVGSVDFDYFPLILRDPGVRVRSVEDHSPILSDPMFTATSSSCGRFSAR